LFPDVETECWIEVQDMASGHLTFAPLYSMLHPIPAGWSGEYEDDLDIRQSATDKDG
jgi:hypothetical protein